MSKIYENNEGVATYAGASASDRPSAVKRGTLFLYENGDVEKWTGTQWVQTSAAGKASVIAANQPVVAEEIYEIVPSGTVGAASITSNTWIATQSICGGMIYAKGDSITSTTAWTLNAHYSFDGISEITSEVIATGTSAVATGAETLSLNFGEKVDGADAAGFASKLKSYPFIKFSLAFTNGTAAGTAESMARVVRVNG